MNKSKKDLKMYKEIFKSEKFKPDQIKIYPCQVLKGSGLEALYYGGEYVPYTKNIVFDLIVEMYKLTPEYCRIMRVMREIPPSFLVAGILNIDLRKDIEERLRENGKLNKKIKEIRFREIGFALRDNRGVDMNLRVKKTVYKAAGGKEVFLEVVNKDNILFGLLRLRLEKDYAIIRELHIYGPALELGEVGDLGQHKGFGRELLKMAEEISKKAKKNKIKIISGVGVREYYKNLGYSLDKDKIYMQKKL